MNQYEVVLLSQLEASLSMLRECLEKCPESAWDKPIAKYPFWEVAYHTLCFADYYLSADEASFQPQTGPGGIHPAGLAELMEEHPSRRFERAELVAYTGRCRDKARECLARETPDSLSGPSGFSRLPISRAELHLYNLRHIQHHTGQLSAMLRREDTATGWVRAGWR